MQGNLLDIALPSLTEDAVDELLNSIRDELTITGCCMDPAEINTGVNVIMSAYQYMEQMQEQLQRFHKPTYTVEPEL